MTTVPLAYLNGRFLPQTEASLPLHDAGFVMGATVTDFCRTFNRVLFRWPDHLARLRRDCAACFIPLTQPDAELTGIAEELVRYNAGLLGPGQELALITFATPGPIGYYLGEPGGAGDGPPTLGMHTFPLPCERYRGFFAEGVTLAVTGHRSHADELFPAQVKHRSRLNWWRADRLLRNRQRFPAHAIALLLDGFDSGITETAIGHFLLVKEGTVLSPYFDRVLDGISVRYVEELCDQLGIPFQRSDISVPECACADEAMLCGTAFCLAGVSRIDDWSIPWPGPVFTRLLSAWSERAGLDIARQILANP